MWTRAELKARAKENLKRYYWAAFAVSLIVSLIGGNGNSSTSGFNAGVNATQEYNMSGDFSGDVGALIGDIPNVAGEIVNSIDAVALGIVAMLLMVAAVIGLVLNIFVIPVIKVGADRFYMESRQMGYSAGVSELAWGFKNNYLNIVWTMFLRNLIVTLGSICCVIPGIYLSYCYYMVPYILAENPDMRAADVLRLSKDMMEGQKLNTWVLSFSFMGWWIVGALACGIGTFFIQPYYDATFAELYATLRQRFSYCLNGFGNPDMGPGYGGYYGQQDGNGGYYYGSQENNGGYYSGPYGNNDAYYNGQFEQSGNSYDPYNNGQNGGYNSNMNWQQTPPQYGAQMPNEQPQQEDRGGVVKRSEGGPGRGYYLNGEFYPYTEEELDQLDKK